MTRPATFILRPGPAFARVLTNCVKYLSMLPVDRAWEIIIRNPKSQRTVEQNARLHAMCDDVSRQHQWAGKTLDQEGWKRLFVDAWARETGNGGGQVVPSLDGQSVVVLNRSTKAMSVAELSELMEWITAWCVEQGVVLNDREAA